MKSVPLLHFAARASWRLAPLVFLAATELWATDWPRFRGADHLAISSDASLARWPTNGLGVAWRRPLPGGHGSFAVCGDEVFTLRVTNETSQELCVALNADTGTQLWGTVLGPRAGYPANSTPTVKDGRVYAYCNGELKLFCLDQASGAVVWQRNLVTEFGGSPKWDNSQSPWVEDGRIFVSIIAPTNCLLAFNATNGVLLWRGLTNGLTYASPLGATLHGVRQIIFPDRYGLVSVAPATGQLLWRYRRGISDGPSPVFYDDIGIYATTDLAGGAVFRVLCTNGVFSTTELWTNSALSGMFFTAVVHEGYLYGFFQNSLQCRDLQTGDLQWTTACLGSQAVVLSDHHLVCLGESGQLVLAKPSPLGYAQISACTAVSTPECVNTPACSNGRIYVGNPNEIACLDAGIPAPLQISAARSGASRIRLTVSNSDGRAIYTNRAPQIRVRWSSDLAQQPDTWTGVPGLLQYTNGALFCDQPFSYGSTPRFYLGLEEGR